MNPVVDYERSFRSGFSVATNFEFHQVQSTILESSSPDNHFRIDFCYEGKWFLYPFRDGIGQADTIYFGTLAPTYVGGSREHM